MIKEILAKSVTHPIKTLSLMAFVGGFGIGVRYGLYNALFGGVCGVLLTLLVVYGKPHHTPIE